MVGVIKAGTVGGFFIQLGWAVRIFAILFAAAMGICWGSMTAFGFFLSVAVTRRFFTMPVAAFGNHGIG